MQSALLYCKICLQFVALWWKPLSKGKEILRQTALQAADDAKLTLKPGSMSTSSCAQLPPSFPSSITGVVTIQHVLAILWGLEAVHDLAATLQNLHNPLQPFKTPSHCCCSSQHLTSAASNSTTRSYSHLHLAGQIAERYGRANHFPKRWNILLLDSLIISTLSRKLTWKRAKVIKLLARL